MEGVVSAFDLRAILIHLTGMMVVLLLGACISDVQLQIMADGYDIMISKE